MQITRDSDIIGDNDISVSVNMVEHKYQKDNKDLTTLTQTPASFLRNESSYCIKGDSKIQAMILEKIFH